MKTQAEKLARELATQVNTLDELNGLMRTLMKSAIERMLNTEMHVHLQHRAVPPTDLTPTASAPNPDPNLPVPLPKLNNRRNGHSQKTIQGDMGELKIQTPRDRPGTLHRSHSAKANPHSVY